MANPSPTPTDAVGSSPADSESREAATRPQNAPLATTATAGPVSASSLVPVAGGHRDTIIQVKTIALWSVLQHSRAMVVVVVVLYDEGCLTAVTSMNSSRGRVPALLNQHDGHHHAGRGGECAKWCLVCSLRDRTTAVGAKGLGWAIGSLCVPPLPPGRCQLLRVVGFSPIFA